MKKIYTLLILALVSVFAANAGTMTVKTDAESSGKVSVTANGTTSVVTEEGVTVTFNDYAYNGDSMTFTATEGYEFESVYSTLYKKTYTDSYISTIRYYFQNGDVAIVKVKAVGGGSGGDDPEEDDTKVAVFKGEKGKYQVKPYNINDYCYYRDSDDNGEITVEYENYTRFDIQVTNEGDKIESITDQFGNTYGSLPAAYTSFSTSDLPANKMEFTVKMVEVVEQKSFDVTPHGSKCYIIQMYKWATTTDDFISGPMGFYTDGETTNVPFEDGVYYSFSSTSSSNPIAKLEVNGVVQTPNQYGGYNYYPTDGDKIDIYTDMEVKDVPVKFEYTGGAGEDIVSEVYVQGGVGYLRNDEWKAEDFTLTTGTSMDVTFNTNDYEDIVVKVNGVEQTLLGYGQKYITVTIGQEESYTITCSGTRLQPYYVTILTENPEGFKVFNSQYGSANDPEFVLDGEETTLEVSTAAPYLYFEANYGYKIVSVETELEANSSGVYTVSGDCEIVVEVVELSMNSAMVYFEDIEWGYTSITIGSTTIEPVNGYNPISFLAGEEVRVYAYPAAGNAVLYYNGELQEKVNYVYECLANLQDGDVLKFYGEEKTPHALSYSIAEGVTANITVKHDYLQEVEMGEHSVLPGTIVHMTAVSAPAPATMARVNNTPIKVKVNADYVEPDEDGVFTFAVNADTQVAVEKNTQTGIENIEAGALRSQDVYNLQGVKVDGNNLPAGIYIRGGKKFIVK